MNYYVIPEPYKMEELEGKFYFDYNTEIVLDSLCSEKEYGYAKLLAETVKKNTGIVMPIRKGEGAGTNEVYLHILPEDEEMPENVKVLLGLAKGDKNWVVPDAETEKYWKIRTESYTLEISKERIEISARYANGILYGIQTLRQLVDQLAMVLPCLKVEDRPQLANRGFYHDATRGRIQTTESYKKLADKLSYYKINQLQLYVEHSYLFRDFSEVWRDDTPLTAEDIMELDGYCKAIGIELIPSVASFGHLDKVLKTKSFAHLCELENSDKDRFSFIDRMAHHTINMSDPESWEFIEKMLLEFIPLFSSRQFNLCGDETFDLGKGRSKAMAEEIGTHRMYVNFVKKICECLTSQGLRPMFWGDIIVGSPELLHELPESIVCLTWGYGEQESDYSAKTMDSVGAVQYLCPGVHGWRHIMNRLPSAYANVSRMCDYAKKYNALGLLNTDWGDFGHVAHQDFSIPGMIYGAAGSWSEELLPEDEMNRRISKVEFGDATESVVDIFAELGLQEGVAWEYLAQYMEYLTGDRIPPKESQIRFYGNMHVNKPAEKNVKIAEILAKLAEVSVNLNSTGKNVVPTYFLHAKGQMIFNSVAGTIGALVLGLEVEEAEEKELVYTAMKAVVEPKKLAVILEKWFYEYKKLWRVTCRESELYRIQNVIFWLADFLRDVQ